MDVSEADHLARDFAQYARDNRQRAASSASMGRTSVALWAGSIILVVALAGGIALAFT